MEKFIVKTLENDKTVVVIYSLSEWDFKKLEGGKKVTSMHAIDASNEAEALNLFNHYNEVEQKKIQANKKEADLLLDSINLSKNLDVQFIFASDDDTFPIYFTVNLNGKATKLIIENDCGYVYLSAPSEHTEHLNRLGEILDDELLSASQAASFRDAIKSNKGMISNSIPEWSIDDTIITLSQCG